MKKTTRDHHLSSYSSQISSSDCHLYTAISATVMNYELCHYHFVSSFIIVEVDLPQ